MSELERLTGFLETPEQFVRWLIGKDGDEIVGVSQKSRNCPIHNFLAEKTDTQFGAGGCGLWAIDNDFSIGALVEIPEWATCFIDTVDRNPHLPFRTLAGRAITARQALQVLGSIIPVEEYVEEKELVTA